jgi:hypothetical protein
VPGAEGGRVDQVDSGDSAARQAARAALWLPKILFETVTEPLYGATWAYNEYDLANRYYDLFYNRDHTIGFAPTGSYATGLGPLVGATFVSTNTFGEKEHVSLDAEYGGANHDQAIASINSGKRLGRVTLGVIGNFEQYPDFPFFGIGNNNVSPEPQGIDARVNPTAFETYYRSQEARVSALADVRVVSHFHVIGRGALAALDYGRSSTGIPIDQVYNPAGLVGFEQSPRHVYGELELRWDGRGRGSVWEPVSVHSVGSLASVYGGEVHSIDGMPDFARYGFDLQQGFRLGAGPRALLFRVLGQGVTGSLYDVPFAELPYLGGDLLRGYDYGRFRDRIAALGSVEYLWDVSHNADVYLFVDTGRVYSSLSELTFDNMRMGYGVGIELHDAGGFLVEGSVASSIDGGLFFTASFHPIFDELPRWR